MKWIPDLGKVQNLVKFRQISEKTVFSRKNLRFETSFRQSRSYKGVFFSKKRRFFDKKWVFSRKSGFFRKIGIFSRKVDKRGSNGHLDGVAPGDLEKVGFFGFPRAWGPFGTPLKLDSLGLARL